MRMELYSMAMTYKRFAAAAVHQLTGCSPHLQDDEYREGFIFIGKLSDQGYQPILERSWSVSKRRGFDSLVFRQFDYKTK